MDKKQGCFEKKWTKVKGVFGKNGQKSRVFAGSLNFKL